MSSEYCDAGRTTPEAAGEGPRTRNRATLEKTDYKSHAWFFSVIECELLLVHGVNNSYFQSGFQES
jgi:hypothetical protein